MAATLRPDSTATKAETPAGVTEERLRCNDDSCGARWVMAYQPEEHAAEGESVVETMREKAAELIASTHSAHDFKNYVWAGLTNGWVVVEKDLTAAGL
jgi:hypothetical protein